MYLCVYMYACIYVCIVYLCVCVCMYSQMLNSKYVVT